MVTERRYSTAEGRQALATGRIPGDLKLPDRPKVKRADPERQLQRAVAEMLDRAGVVYFHVPNERRDRIEAMRLAAEGVKPGVPDICFPYALSGLPRCGWIELKSETGSLSLSQRQWRETLKSIGHEWAMLRTVEAVAETLVFWRVPGAERIRF